MATFKAIGNPRLETLTGADVLGLIAIGLCFGVALAGFIDLFIGALISRQSPQESTEAELARLQERIAELEQQGQKRTS
jgi:hypothetical protein